MKGGMGGCERHAAAAAGAPVGAATLAEAAPKAAEGAGAGGSSHRGKLPMASDPVATSRWGVAATAAWGTPEKYVARVVAAPGEYPLGNSSVLRPPAAAGGPIRAAACPEGGSDPGTTAAEGAGEERGSGGVGLLRQSAAAGDPDRAVAGAESEPKPRNPVPEGDDGG